MLLAHPIPDLALAGSDARVVVRGGRHQTDAPDRLRRPFPDDGPSFGLAKDGADHLRTHLDGGMDRPAGPRPDPFASGAPVERFRIRRPPRPQDQTFGFQHHSPNQKEDPGIDCGVLPCDIFGKLLLDLVAVVGPLHVDRAPRIASAKRSQNEIVALAERVLVVVEA